MSRTFCFLPREQRFGRFPSPPPAWTALAKPNKGIPIYPFPLHVRYFYREVGFMGFIFPNQLGSLFSRPTNVPCAFFEHNPTRAVLDFSSHPPFFPIFFFPHFFRFPRTVMEVPQTGKERVHRRYVPIVV